MPTRRRLVVLGLPAPGIAVAWASTQRDDDTAPDQAAEAATPRPFARMLLEPEAELLDWHPSP